MLILRCAFAAAGAAVVAAGAVLVVVVAADSDIDVGMLHWRVVSFQAALPVCLAPEWDGFEAYEYSLFLQ